MLCRAASCSARSASQLAAPHASATSCQVSRVGLTSPGATSRIITSIRDSNFSASAIFAVDQRLGLKRLERDFEARVRPTCLVSCSTCTANSRSTNPPGSELHVERSARRLVALPSPCAFSPRRARPSRNRAACEGCGRSSSPRARGPRASRTPAERGISAICSHVQASSRWYRSKASSETTSMPLAPSGRSRVSTS